MGLVSHLMLGGHSGASVVAAGAPPRINPRTGRGVAASSPDHKAISGPATVPVMVSSVQPAIPFALRTIPRRRMGPVPKLAPGHQGSGLGQPVGAGFQALQYPGFTPLENAPATRASSRIEIPHSATPFIPGGVLSPTYRADAFAPATRQFNQARSSVPWAQSSFTPQQRPLTPSQQGVLLQRPTGVRRQIPAAQSNPGLYTIGYPTRVGVAARIGGGPIAVLGGNSQ